MVVGVGHDVGPEVPALVGVNVLGVSEVRAALLEVDAGGEDRRREHVLDDGLSVGELGVGIEDGLAAVASLVAQADRN